MKGTILLVFLLSRFAAAQEAQAGFDLRATLSAIADYTHQLSPAPRDGAPESAGFRAMLYPTFKISDRWAIAGAVQIHSRPYFYEELHTQGYGVRADVLQAHLDYSRFWSKGSLLFRAGELSSAFGSFLLRYDDAVNPLIDMPPEYGYYYKPVTSYGLAGAQMDATLGKFDVRAQFATSSPANRRGVFDHDQYANWTAGAGWTIRQGLRVGVSAYRGPYLHRQYAFYFPGEAPPRELPATAGGIDVEWGHGPWNVYGEWQRFLFTYRAIENFREDIGYAEARRSLGPRWYLAARIAYVRVYERPGRRVYEAAAGFRPGHSQLIKVGYQIQEGQGIRSALSGVLAVQFVTSLNPVSVAWRRESP